MRFGSTVMAALVVVRGTNANVRQRSPLRSLSVVRSVFG
jgi:hypothetical protein